MAKVIAGMTMSLDGFIADKKGDIYQLYPDLHTLRDTPLMQEYIKEAGAVLMGKRTFELGDPDEYVGNYEFQVPIFVLTHHIPDIAPKQDEHLTFTFVIDGVISAIEQAKAAAGEKVVQVVGGVSLVQQLFEAGLVDEFHVDIMPIFLGEGRRFFESPVFMNLKLEKIDVREVGDRTNLRFRVIK